MTFASVDVEGPDSGAASCPAGTTAACSGPRSGMGPFDATSASPLGRATSAMLAHMDTGASVVVDHAVVSRSTAACSRSRQ